MAGLGRAATRIGGPALGRALGGGFTTLGLGGISDAVSDDDEWSLGDALRDFGVGAVGGNLGSLLGGLARGTARRPGARSNVAMGRKIEDLLNTRPGKILKSNTASMLGAGGLTIGMRMENEDAKDRADVIGSAQGAFDNIGNNIMARHGSSLAAGGIAPMNGGLLEGLYGGDPMEGLDPIPTFDKTFADYLADRDLNKLANAQIIQANKALIRENEDTRKELVRNVGQNTTSHAALQEELARLKAADAKAAQATNEEAARLHRDSAATSNRILEDLGVGMSGSDSATAENAAMQERVHANQDADKDYLEALSSGSASLLGNMAGASAMQGQEQERMMRRDANDRILDNREQASDNWLQKPTLLGQFADTALKNDLQKHQLGLQSWGQKLDALNAYRNSQYQMGQLGLQQQQVQASSQPDPMEQMQFMLKLLNSGTGIKRTVNDPDTGLPITIDERMGDRYTQDQINAMGLPMWRVAPQAQIDQTVNAAQNTGSGLGKVWKTINPFD